MPRAYDQHQLKPSHDPLKSGSELHVQLEVDQLATIWTDIFDSLRNTIIDFIKNLTGIDLSAFAELIDGLSESLSFDLFDLAGIPMGLLGSLQTLLQQFGDALFSGDWSEQPILGFMHQIQALLDAVFGGLLTGPLEFLSNLWTLVEAIRSALLDGDPATTAMGAFVTWLQTIADTVFDGLLSGPLELIASFAQFLDTAWVGLVEGSGPLADLIAWISSITDAVLGNLIQGPLEFIGDVMLLVSSVKDALLDGDPATSAITGIVTWMQTIADTVMGGLLKGPLEFLASLISFFDSFAAALAGDGDRSPILGIIDWFQKLPDLIVHLFGDTIFGPLLDIVIPPLDTGKITTGVFGQDRIDGLDVSLDDKLPRETFDAITPGGNWNAASDPTMSTASLWNDTAYESFAIANTGYWGFKSVEVTCLSPAHNPRVRFVRDSRGDAAALMVTPGDKFDFHCYVLARSGNSSPTDMGIQVALVDSTGGEDPIYLDGETTTPSTYLWKKLNMDVIIPAGYDTADFYVYVESDCAVGDQYLVDTPIIKEVTAPTDIATALFGQKQVGVKIEEGVVPDLPQDRITDLPGDLDSKTPLIEFDLRARDFENLTAGSDFEGDNPWSLTAGFSISTEQARSGDQSLKIQAGQGYSTYQSLREYAVEPDSEVYVEFWVWKTADYDAADHTYQRFRIARGASSATSPGSTITSTYFATQDIPQAETWTKLTNIVTVPDGIYTIQIGIMACTNGTAGAVYMDDIVVRRVKAPDTIGELPQDKVTDLPDDMAAKLPRETFDAITPGGSNICTDPTMSTASLWQDASTATYAIANIGFWGTKSLEITCAHTPNVSWPDAHLVRNSEGQEAALLVTEYDKFDFSCWVRAKSGNSGNWGMNLQVLFTDSTGALPGTNSSGSSLVPSTLVWSKLSMDVTVPAGYDTANFRVYIDYAAAVGDVFYADSPVIRETTSGTTIAEKIFGQKQIATTVEPEVIPPLDSSKISTGTLGTDRIPSLNADKLTAGTLAADRIPQLAQDKIDGLGTSLANLVTATTSGNLCGDPTIAIDSYWAGNLTAYKSLDTTVKRSGAQSLKLVAQGGGSAQVMDVLRSAETGVRADVPASSGQRFRMECYLKGDPGNTSSTAKCYFQLHASDSQGEVTAQSLIVKYYLPDTSDWTHYTAEGVFPEGGFDTLRALVGWAGTADAGDIVWVEDISVTNISQITEIVDTIVSGLDGTGLTLQDLSDAVGNIPGGNIASAILSSIVPPLDATKITSGQFPQSQIVDLPTDLDNAQTTADRAKEYGEAIIARGGNIFSNGGFESDAFYHGNAGGVRSSEQSRGGTYSRKCIHDGVNYAIVYLNTDDVGEVVVPCRAGDVFAAEAWIYGHDENVTTTKRYWFQWYWRQADGNNTAGLSAGFTYLDPTIGVWTKMSATITAPPEAVGLARFWLVGDDDIPDQNTYYLDDCLLFNVTEGHNAQLAADAADGKAEAAQGDAEAAQGTANAALPKTIFNAQVGAANTASDPNMSTPELWVSGDSGGTPSYTTDQAYHGTGCIQLEANGSTTNPYIYLHRNAAGAAQFIPAEGGDVYSVSVWARAHPGNTASDKEARIYIGWRDKDSIETATTLYSDVVVPHDDWVQVSGTSTAPAGTVRARFLTGPIRGSDAADGDVWYFDRPVIREITAADAADVKALAAQTDVDVAGVTLDLIRTTGAGNLVTCGTMEDPNVYYAYGGTRTSEQAHSGSYSYRWDGNVASSLHLIADATTVKRAPCSPTDVYYAEFWIMGDDNNIQAATSGLEVKFQIKVYDPTDGSGGSVWTGPVLPLGDHLNGVWTKVTGYVVMGSGDQYTTMDPYVVITGEDTGEVYYIDDVSLYRATEAVRINQQLFDQDTPGTTVESVVIPPLDASKVETGTLSDGRIPNLAQSKITDLGTDLGAKASRDSLIAKLVAGDNISSNPSFEDTEQYIHPNHAVVYSYTTEQARNGTHSLKMVSNGALYAVQYIIATNTAAVHYPVYPGQVFLAEFWVRGHTDNTQTTGMYDNLSMTVLAQFRESGNVYVGSTSAGWTTATTALNDVWTKVSGYITVPTTAAYEDVIYADFFVLFRCQDIESGETYYVDDVSVRWVSDSVSINQKLYGANEAADAIIAGAVPSLDASKVTTGTLGDSRIPTLAQTKITSLTTDLAARLTSSSALNGSNITTGTVADARIDVLDSSKITTGTLGTSRIPTLAQSKVTSLTSDLAAKLAEANFSTYLRGGANLLLNGSFDDTTIPLGAGYSAERSTDYSRSGAYSMKVTGTDATQYIRPGNWDANGASVSIKANAGQAFYYEAWVFGHPSNMLTGSVEVGSLGLWCYNSASVYQGNVRVYVYASTVGTNSWVKISGIVRIPDNDDIVHVTPLLYCANNFTSPNVYYFDDILLRDATEAVDTNRKLFDQNAPGDTVESVVIPPLDASVVQTGTLGTNRIPTLDQGKITDLASDLAEKLTAASSLNGDKITSGTVDADRLDNIDASKVDTGTLGTGRIPTLDQGKITDLTSDLAEKLTAASSLNGDKITSGTVDAARIDNLSATKITSGELGIARIPTGDLDKDNIADLGGTIDKIVGGWFNDEGTGKTLANVFDTLRESKRNVDEVSAGLAALQADQNAGAAGGTSYAVKVSDTASIPPSFSVAYNGSGALEYNSADGGVVRYGNTTGMEYWCHSGALLTPYQEVSLLITKQTGWLIGNRSVYFIARRSGNSAIICKLNGSAVTFGHTTSLSSGGFTALSGPHTVALGSYMTFRCGVGTSKRTVQLLSNNVVQKQVELSSAVDAYDANRNWGFGVENQYDFLVNYSAYISQMYANDNEQPTIPGTGATMRRTSGTTTWSCAAGTSDWPTSFWQTPTDASPDINADTTNGRFYVTTPGWYSVNASVVRGTASAPYNTHLILCVNGSTYMSGNESTGATYLLTAEATSDILTGQWRVPLAAGDYVSLKVWASDSTASPAWAVDATGTYFQISK